MTQAQPQSAQSPQSQSSDSQQANNPNDPTGCVTNPTGQKCQQCTANPNDPSCQGQQQPQGQSSFGQTEEGKDKADFNVPDVGSAQPNSFAGGSSGQGGQPAKNGTVANNSGGGIPGAGGGGGGGGGAAQGRASTGSPGYTTDILQGYQSGSPQSAGGSLGTDGGGGFGGYGNGNSHNGHDSSGMDLKQFLPGNSRAPSSLNAAGYSLQSPEIGSKHGDIWEKVSRKYMDKCRRSQLIGCE